MQIYVCMPKPDFHTAFISDYSDMLNPARCCSFHRASFPSMISLLKVFLLSFFPNPHSVKIGQFFPPASTVHLSVQMGCKTSNGKKHTHTHTYVDFKFHGGKRTYKSVLFPCLPQAPRQCWAHTKHSKNACQINE